MRIEFTILGQAASKANSRRLVKIADRPRSIKSKAALAFERSMLLQIPPAARRRLEGPVRVSLRIFYANERSDLDESVILDCLQDRYVTERLTKAQIAAGVKPARELVQYGVYRNDRQVRMKVVTHGIDRANPRAHIIIEPLQAQQMALALDDAFDPFELLEA